MKGGLAYDIGYGTQVGAWGGIAKMHEEVENVCGVLLLDGIDPIAYLEHVTASPIMGKRSAFTFGHNFGQWETLLYCLNVRVELVKPQMWQRGIPGLSGSDRKRALKAHAARLYPNLRVTGATQDALLILDYAKRINHG